MKMGEAAVSPIHDHVYNYYACAITAIPVRAAMIHRTMYRAKAMW